MPDKNNQIEKLKRTELRISNKLFIICGVVTFVTMAMVAVEFFTCGFFSLKRIEFFYLAVLLLYALHKELIRWLGEDKVERQGEYFVYAWVGLTTMLYIVHFFTKGRFSYMPDCDTGPALRNATFIALEVLAVFIFTRFLKVSKIFFGKTK